MANGKVIVGFKCKAYYDESGAGNGTWKELKKIGDVTVSLPRESGQLRERGSDFLKTLVGQVDAEATLTLTRRPGDEAYDAFFAAHVAGADIGVQFASEDRTAVGAETFTADWKITGWQINAPAQGGEASTVEVTMKPSGESATDPEYAVVASGGGS